MLLIRNKSVIQQWKNRSGEEIVTDRCHERKEKVVW